MIQTRTSLTPLEAAVARQANMAATARLSAAATAKDAAVTIKVAGTTINFRGTLARMVIHGAVDGIRDYDRILREQFTTEKHT